MVRAKKSVGLVFVVAVLALGLGSTAYAVDFDAYVVGDVAAWMLNNDTGAAVTGIHIEFDQEVTITGKVEIGGLLPALGGPTGTAFDFNGGSLVAGGTLILEWQPADAKPTYILWMNGERAAGKPYFTSVAQLGFLFGQGIVHLREANPEALAAAFAQFFADNAEYLTQVSQSLGMSLQDSLMPIIMSAPAEGIQNF
ncbi:MAG: hypothetical protein PHW86_02935, partial [Candidatus Bipolaricaulis sp.]|nr:hypothetical protein [Candidatus Bipolaricaulis sp.]